MPFKSYKEQSKCDWGRDTEGNLCDQQLMLGAALRIADAVEKMAKNYQALISERDRYKLWYDAERNNKHAAWRSRAALKGVVTKLKKAG